MSGTTYFSLTLPAIGNTTTWGITDNANWTTVDNALYVANGGLTTGINVQSSASSITLTNPLDSTQEINFSAAGQSLILPPMNATFSPVVGGIINVINNGSYPFGVLAQDGSTVVYGTGALAGTITGGAGYTNGVYEDVALTGGAGSGARATITVAGAVVTGVSLTSESKGFAIGNSLTTANSNIGGTGSGFAFVLTAVTGVPVGATLQIEVASVSTANGTFNAVIDGNLYSGNNLNDLSDTNTALNNLLPPQSGNSGSVLQTNGSNTSWSNALSLIEVLYPIGTIYSNATNATNPATLLGFGTWTALQGLVLIGAGSYTDADSTSKTFTAGTVYGEFNHTLVTGEMPSHNHTDTGHVHTSLEYVGASGIDVGAGAQTIENNNTSTGYANISYTGGGGAHNNIQPSLAVYAWQRTA